jgi:formamidopyrimidine-DNA glycosylase
MPELPEVETVRRRLLPALAGRRIVGVDVRERRLRSPIDPMALASLVSGRRVEDVSRRAKYLLVHLEGGSCLLIHFGMSGRLALVPASAPLEEHVHVRFGLDDGLELRFRDHRRFGLVEALLESELECDRRLRELGMEPLSRSCTARFLEERSRGLKKPVKNFLMDARHLVGVGNIYASEALFAAGVHPERAAGRLGRERWLRLAKAVKRVLRDAIRQGGTTISDFQDPAGAAGYFQVRLRVYGREGEACGRCGSTIRRKVMAGRSSFYCPRCQR